MGSWRYIGALALSPLILAVEVAPPLPSADDPRSAAERIDLTRITVLHADYARAAQQRNARDLAAYEREIVAMLREDVLPYARDDAPPGASGGGTGGGASAPARPAAAPAVAVDEEEVGAASINAKVVDLARQFMALEGKTDGESLARKSSILGSLQGISEQAQYPGTTSDAERNREVRQRVQHDRREREEAEKLPTPAR
jgi:hypothetical protein